MNYSLPCGSVTNFVFIFQWSINPWIRLWRIKTNFEEKLECKKCDEDHEWQCGLDCITKSETCNGNCPDDYLFCNEYSKCIEITTPCEDKCLSMKQPRLKKKSKHRYFFIEYSNSERSEQFLVTEYFFNLFLEVSHT